MEDVASFGRWLMERRQSLDLTRDDVADRVGCAPITIAKIERDERRPSRQMAERLAEALRLPDDQRAAFIDWARGITPLPVPTAVPEGNPDHRPSTSSNEDQSAIQNPKSKIQNPGVLPSSVTSFVGRERDVASIKGLLWRADMRIVTLTGPPGIGKTRLSLTTAASLRDDFEHGVCFVPLAPVTDPELVADTIAQSLIIPESPTQSAEETIASYLRGRQMLLLLDNFEQVTPAALLLARLTAYCPRIKLLITSRETLHIYGEHEYPVPPLMLPDRQSTPTLENLAASPAVTLFAQRAQAVNPHFKLTTRNAATIAEICRKLDGLPLAIELAAARVRMLAPDALLARLQDPEPAKEGHESRLDILTGGPRDLPARQQTLRGAIHWSYTLLSPKEQALFRALGVFVGGCTSEAIEASSNPHTGGQATMDLIASLVDKSLVRQEGDTSQTQRLTMLEVIREYALERLAEAGELQEARVCHLAYYSNLALQSDLHHTGQDQMYWLDRVEAERDNIRAALRWALDIRLREEALRLTGTLWSYWYIRDHTHEGIQWLQEALQNSYDLPAKLRAEAIFGIAGLTILQDEYVSARPYFEEALALFRQLDDKASIARCINGLSLAHVQVGEFEKAIELLKESVKSHEEQGDIPRLALACSNLSYALLQARVYTDAREYGNRALHYRRDMGNLWGIASSMLILGGIAMHEGKYTEAVQSFEECIDYARRVGERRDTATALMALGLCDLKQGKPDEALDYYVQSLNIYQDLRNNFGIARTLIGMSGIASANGQHLEAVRLCSAALAHCKLLLPRLLPDEYDLYEQIMRHARATMDPHALEAATTAGSATPIEDTIRLVKRET